MAKGGNCQIMVTVRFFHQKSLSAFEQARFCSRKVGKVGKLAKSLGSAKVEKVEKVEKVVKVGKVESCYSSSSHSIKVEVGAESRFLIASTS